jgi:hypothetical protein
MMGHVTQKKIVGAEGQEHNSTKHQEDIEVIITNTENHDLLLGTDWLKAYNPSID